MKEIEIKRNIDKFIKKVDMGNLLLFWYTIVENEKYVEILWELITFYHWIQELASDSSVLVFWGNFIGT